MSQVDKMSRETSQKSKSANRTESVPQIEFRPNPLRSISLNGEINQDLVYRLTPSIIRLQHESRDPITVYIDSPGGSVASASSILRLLRTPALDTSLPSRVITVVTSLAASAAAILLTSGDYAVAFPGSLIHFHGVRTSRQNPITVEEAADVAKDLKAGNEASAVALARSRNFFFRFLSLRSDFDDYRAKNPNVATEKDCFIGMISERLTPLGLEVIKKAEIRYKRYESLSERIFGASAIQKQLKLMQKSEMPENYRKLEAEMLKVIISFEISSNKNNSHWTFADVGLAQLTDDFYLLNEYIGQHKNDWIEEFCGYWKDIILDEVETEAIARLPEEERKAARVQKITPVLLPLWLFFGAVCHVPQEEENPLTPHDAFWLGLVDEVSGANLPTLRRLVERKPIAATKVTL